MKTGLWRSNFRVWLNADCGDIAVSGGVCDRRGKSKWGTNYVDYFGWRKKNKNKKCHELNWLHF